jgi:PTH1 family peptidyl-tRNA hydrolase
MKWFVGLGNPGPKYAMNRHNVGFMALDVFASRHGFTWKAAKTKAEWAEGIVSGEKVVLIKPTTYMNLSGEAVRFFLDDYHYDPEDLVVLYDDLDTEFGAIRLRYKGGPGGHNGIKSIIAHLGTSEFKRVRIGISRPEPGIDIADYVLSDFPRADRDELKQVLEQVADAMEHMLTEPFDKVMAQYNRRA